MYRMIFSDLFNDLSEVFDFNNTVNNTVKQLPSESCKCIKDKENGNVKSFSEYRQTVKDGVYNLNIVATGYDETMIKVNVSPSDNTLTVTGDVKEKKNDSWFMPNINISVKLPKDIAYDSLKKEVKNGVITITGKIAVPEKAKTFSI